MPKELPHYDEFSVQDIKPKTDFEKLMKERSAAVLLRDDIAFMIGWTKADNPEISERLEEILKNHDENRCQEWL